MLNVHIVRRRRHAGVTHRKHVRNTQRTHCTNATRSRRVSVTQIAHLLAPHHLHTPNRQCINDRL
jgi:hypothetical protein